MFTFFLDPLFVVSLILTLCSGFAGFEIRYSDMTENISVNLSAISGTILLSPMLMQFWSPWSVFSVFRGVEEANGLVLDGTVEVVNFGLKSIQYLGYYSLIYNHFLSLI